MYPYHDLPGFNSQTNHMLFEPTSSNVNEI